MATGATGTPTANYSIPKYSTSADAPNGSGFNSAMDFIDNLLKTGFIPKPAGLVAGDVPVWNGTDWVVPTGTPDGTKFLRDDGAWGAVSVPSTGYGIALPGSPTDGQEYILVDSTTAPTYQWRFRYNASNSGSYKWEFVGGSPKWMWVAAGENTGSTSYVDLTTPGPSITIPVSGEYDFRYGASIATASGTLNGYIGLHVNGAAANEIASLGPFGGAAQVPSFGAMELRMVALATQVVKLMYKVSGGNMTFGGRWLSIQPRVVG